MSHMAEKSSKTMWITLTVVVLAVIMIGYMFMPGNSQEVVKKPEKKNTEVERKNPEAPDFALQDLEGNIVKLSDYKGKVVFVNFWATWCPPCRAEIPYFVELVDEYKDDFIVLGITVDNQRDLPKVPSFAESYKINYPILVANNETVAAYGGISNIPTTFVVDPEGLVVGRIVGSRPKEQFEQIIKDTM